MNTGAVAALARRRARSGAGGEAGGAALAVDDGASASAQLASLRCGASDGALLFLHADTRLPPDALRCVQLALAAPGVVGGGFVSFPESAHKTWYFQAIHNGAHCASRWLCLESCF
jgi:hypothetical protein